MTNMMKSSYHFTGCKQKTYKILVVDDSKTFNQKVSDGLGVLGHQITQAYSLKETKELISKNEYDFILLDLILPDGEGNELIDDLDQKTKAKVIVLSGDNDYQRRSHIFESGILDYFSKTNSVHKIIDDVKKLLCTVQINSKVNILLVDDSSFMRKMLKSILSPKRFNLIEAIDGKEGIDILNDVEIHLVLLDYEMPVMDGIEFIEIVKKRVEFLDLPIIMLSGNDDKNVISRALKNGASDFLKKPFATEELLLKCDLHVKNYLNLKIIKEKDQELIRSLEKTHEAEQHKAMFLANMSHEIRTPLNAIIGFVDLLAEEETDKTKKNYLNTIQKSGDLLLHLVNDILDLSKIENGKIDINKEVFVVEELIELLVSVYEHTIDKKGLKFDVKISNEIPKYLNSDFLRIKQILTNLIGNAIKFTPKGGEITLELVLNDDKQAIKFSVKDTGIGIAKENHTKVFDLFSQAEKTTTKNFGGTGLGLGISSKLVTLLGGKISLDSELDHGSCFYFDVPIDNIVEKQIVHHYAEADKKAQKISTTYDKKILLVEDNITNQKFMQIIFSKYKLQYDIAFDGLEAIELYKTNSYDMIFMDENMPKMNGREATKKIRVLEKSENRKYTPIVALTANALVGDENLFKTSGMDEYLTKPLNKNKLAEIFVKYFEREVLFDMVEQKNEKHVFEDDFLSKFSHPFLLLSEAIESENVADIIKYINIVKIISRKYNYQDIFSLALNIESSAKENDMSSCRNFMIILKGQFSDSQ